MAAAQPVPRKRENEWLHKIKSLVTLAITGYILHTADVVGVMRRSKKIYHSVMYLSLVAHAVFALIGLYLTFVVSRKNPNWEETHMKFIYWATGAVVTGSVLWIIALWPVFHFWMIPLGVCALFFAVSLLDFAPSAKTKDD